jgi:hypothetical protein
MKRSFSISAIALAVLSAAVLPAQAAVTAVSFGLRPSAAAKTCLPKGATAFISDTTFGPFEDMTIITESMPANTLFTVFTTQVPNSPFGLSVYLGDIKTGSDGHGVGHFVGRFSTETFVVSPGAAAAPQEFTKGQFPDAKEGVKVGPVQLYHIGLWFDSPAAAVKAHCANTVTPFNGAHDAGIQALTSSAFAAERGPLSLLTPGS